MQENRGLESPLKPSVTAQTFFPSPITTAYALCVRTKLISKRSTLRTREKTHKHKGWEPTRVRLLSIFMSGNYPTHVVTRSLENCQSMPTARSQRPQETSTQFLAVKSSTCLKTPEEKFKLERSFFFRGSMCETPEY